MADIKSRKCKKFRKSWITAKKHPELISDMLMLATVEDSRTHFGEKNDTASIFRACGIVEPLAKRSNKISKSPCQKLVAPEYRSVSNWDALSTFGYAIKYTRKEGP